MQTYWLVEIVSPPFPPKESYILLDPVACKVVPANYAMIVSEGVYNIDRSEARTAIEGFISEGASAYYLRDEKSAFDCHLIYASIFHRIYRINETEKEVGFFKVTAKA